MNEQNLPDYYRERIAVDDDCWRWLGPVVEGRPRSARGHGHSQWVRRELYIRIKGEIRPGKLLAPPRCDALCVNPDHTKPITRKAHLRDMHASGVINHDAKWRANATTERRRRAKLSLDLARIIRSRDGENREALAREFNVTRSTIDMTMRGECWRDSSSPLATLARQCGLMP